MSNNNQADILILEQSHDTLALFSNDLVNAGYNVLTATGADEALSLISNNSVDLILLDVNMKGKSTDTFIQELKFSPEMSNISVIVLGTSFNANEIETALALGADEYIEKPYIHSVMLNRVCRLLHTSEHNSSHQSFDNYNDSVEVLPPPSIEKPYESLLNSSDDSSESEERFPGIDYTTGVSNVLGDDDLFVEILTMFYDDHAQDKDKIKQSILTHDYATCKSLVHTLKGVAGSIGALDLYKTTQALDVALNLNQEDDYQALFSPVENELNKVVLGLKTEIIDK